MTMKAIRNALTVVLAVLAFGEHAGLLLWGVVWPLGHLAQYPEDGGVNIFLTEASLLFLAFSVGAAVDARASLPRPSLLAALALGLPCGVAVTLALIMVLFLDPVVYYLALLPGVAAVVAPYALARRGSPEPGLGDGPCSILRLPLGHQRLRQAQGLQDASDHRVHDVLDGPGAVVEGGDGGQHGRAGLRDR